MLLESVTSLIFSVLPSCTANTHHSTFLAQADAALKAEVAGLFNVWNSALATLDPKKVADCYAPDGVLLPTVSNQVGVNTVANVILPSSTQNMLSCNVKDAQCPVLH